MGLRERTHVDYDESRYEEGASLSAARHPPKRAPPKRSHSSARSDDDDESASTSASAGAASMSHADVARLLRERILAQSSEIATGSSTLPASGFAAVAAAAPISVVSSDNDNDDDEASSEMCLDETDI
jgi:hypothetical protein